MKTELIELRRLVKSGTASSGLNALINKTSEEKDDMLISCNLEDKSGGEKTISDEQLS